MEFDLSKILDFFKRKVHHKGGGVVVGLDIGSSSIKVVQIRDDKGVPTLDTYGELQLGPYDELEIGRTTDLPTAKLTQAFIDILRESSVTARDVAIAISYNSSFATIVSIPTLNQEELADYISDEARKHIPVHLTTVTLDWFPIGIDQEAGATNVLLAAIHNDALKKYKAVVTAADLHTNSYEIETFSAVRSSIAEGDTSVAVIDFGAYGTRLYVTERGVVTKIHSLQLSGRGCSETIAQTLGMSFEEAEEYKRTAFEGDLAAKKAVYGHVDRGLREMGRVIQQYEEREGVKVGKVILTGGGALLFGLASRIEEVLGMRTERANPFSKVAYPAFLEDTLKEAGPSFTIATGVALRPFLSQ